MMGENKRFNVEYIGLQQEFCKFKSNGTTETLRRRENQKVRTIFLAFDGMLFLG
ncbi:hypothetical protein EDC63_1103 [Sulfurirhabdus autotrophica]|uniref:Uncharacterized protein n=1 Tax=Sulfurirhabdus autotrophica TaxID=1706046 RepID=A0A4R3Y441_9PROT|nr:hypothetical protein EDC63_1103 [Sulfurirhabdus autotrophica]